MVRIVGRWSSYLFLLLLPATVFGLDPSLKISDYMQVNYRAENGLGEDSVLSIARSADGYLWVGGYQGVSRFDGVRFVPLEMPENTDYYLRTINALQSDSHGNLWIATIDGLFCF